MITVDKTAMQRIQDAFCSANHLYCYCVSRNMAQITAFSGTSREEAYVESHFPWEARQILCYSFSDGTGEDVIEHVFSEDYLMARGVAIREAKGKLVGVWLVFGLDADKQPSDQFIPADIRHTDAQSFDESIRLLEVMTKTYFGEKIRTAELEMGISEMEETRRRMEGSLRKNEVLTEILKMLESENAFAELATEILKAAGSFLDISENALVRMNADHKTVEMVSEWCTNPENSLMEAFAQLPQTELPFLTGRPYTVSSGSAMPDAFERFMSAYHISAGVFLPLHISGKPGMYLMFAMMGKKRKWSVEDLKFLNDVKRVLYTILIKRITQNSLASSYTALEAILENVGCGVSVNDIIHKEVLYTNETFHQMVADPEDLQELNQMLEDSQMPLHQPMEYQLRRDGLWVHMLLSEINWVDGRQVRLTTLYDITDMKRYQQQIELQSKTDFLTGLYNRMCCVSDIRQEIHAAVHSGGQGAILYMDLDDFKNINDGLGHQNGDTLLKEIGRVLRTIRGVGSRCYRVGGDEFILLLTHEYIDCLEAVTRQVSNIFTRPWILAGKEYYCTISVGVVMFPKDGRDMDLLMQRADIALLAAKRKGKNRVEYYSESDPNISVRRLDLEKGLRKAVEQGCAEFPIYYQPLIDVTKPDNPCCGAEALLRWDSPALGFILPSEFIPLAEYLGLIIPIGKHVLLEACKRCKYWNDFGHPDYKVNVNLSVVQLLQNDIVDVVREALEISEINPANLTLEVTEGLAINDLKRMRQILNEIRSMGARVALDDFGTGYSSLNHIRSLPIDVIKIDRCFVTDIGEDVFSDAFVKTVSELADTLHLNVCVEGVEKQHQQDMLTRMKVDIIQGFLYDSPLTQEEFEEKYL